MALLKGAYLYMNGTIADLIEYNSVYFHQANRVPQSTAPYEIVPLLIYIAI